MGKINGCLKCLFIFFNVLFGIFGVLLILVAVKASAYSQELSEAGGPKQGWNWVFAIGVLLVSCLGVFAACSESEMLLKVFTGLMVAGLIIMMILGIVSAVYRNKIKTSFPTVFEDNSIRQHLMADDGFKEFLKGLQGSYSCCGLLRGEDWEDTIPPSCECKGYSGCTPRPQVCSLTQHLSLTSLTQGSIGPAMIYSQSCGVVIVGLIDLAFKIIMGIFFTFAVIALLGMLVSSLMIHQIRRHDSGGRGESIAMKGSGY